MRIWWLLETQNCSAQSFGECTAEEE
jgi:hypothetical protein